MAKVSNYRRELNISQAVASTSFQKENITYRREYFTSFTNDVGVIKLTADKRRAISFTHTLQRDKRYKVELDGNTLVIQGQLSDDGISDNGMRYFGIVKVKGGSILYIFPGFGNVLYIKVNTKLVPIFNIMIQHNFRNREYFIL